MTNKRSKDCRNQEGQGHPKKTHRIIRGNLKVEFSVHKKEIGEVEDKRIHVGVFLFFVLRGAEENIGRNQNTTRNYGAPLNGPVCVHILHTHSK